MVCGTARLLGRRGGPRPGSPAGADALIRAFENCLPPERLCAASPFPSWASGCGTAPGSRRERGRHPGRAGGAHPAAVRRSRTGHAAAVERSAASRTAGAAPTRCRGRRAHHRPVGPPGSRRACSAPLKRPARRAPSSCWTPPCGPCPSPSSPAAPRGGRGPTSIRSGSCGGPSATRPSTWSTRPTGLGRGPPRRRSRRSPRRAAEGLRRCARLGRGRPGPPGSGRRSLRDAYQRLRPLIDDPFLQVTPLEYPTSWKPRSAAGQDEALPVATARRDGRRQRVGVDRGVWRSAAAPWSSPKRRRSTARPSRPWPEPPRRRSRPGRAALRRVAAPRQTTPGGAGAAAPCHGSAGAGRAPASPHRARAELEATGDGRPASAPGDPLA